MASSVGSNTFPLEVWLRILDYSSIGVHRAMSQLSSAFHEITKKRLYHTLVLGDKASLGVTKDEAKYATWCRDLKLFYELHKDRHDWKLHVRGVYLQKGDKFDVFPESEISDPCDDSSNISRTDLADEYHKLIADTAFLFSGAASMPRTLVFYHMTIPYFQRKFWEETSPICGVTSLSLPMDCDQGMDYEWPESIRGIIDGATALRYLEIRDWVLTDSPGPEHYYDEPGTWDLTHVMLTGCGALTEEVEYLLLMPKDLQSLVTTSFFTPDSRLHSMANAISIQETIDVLGCLQNTLVELDLDPGPSELWVRPGLGVIQFPQPVEPYQTHAFQSFTKLRRLKAPLEMFSQSTGKMARRDRHTFYTNFPPTLEKLTLEITSREFFNQVLEQAYALPYDQVVLNDNVATLSDSSCHEESYEKAHELFEELCQLADHKDSLPSLHEVHLLRDPCQWLQCEHVMQCTRQLEQSGISILVYDRAIEGPLTISQHENWI